MSTSPIRPFTQHQLDRVFRSELEFPPRPRDLARLFLYFQLPTSRPYCLALARYIHVDLMGEPAVPTLDRLHNQVHRQLKLGGCVNNPVRG